MIKAIETSYKGYRFRSRLEARWAVFFDALGLKWEYEPEGFDLKAGRYLPDFFLGDRRSNGAFGYGPWFEVKASAPTPLEVSKLSELCDHTCSYGLLVWGQPGDHHYFYFHKEGGVVDSDDGGNPLNEHVGVCWREYEYALAAARSARFEHGESGARRG